MDPFCGSGTVGAVCARLGRYFIGVDLKEEYLQMARRRIETEWEKS
jgi:site-specific DNA-methyltransferase (adenine-specific)